MAGDTSTGVCGLKISPAQREYYSYTGISEELERRGIPSMPRPDFTRPPRTTGAMEADSNKKKETSPNSALFRK